MPLLAYSHFTKSNNLIKEFSHKPLGNSTSGIISTESLAYEKLLIVSMVTGTLHSHPHCVYSL